MRFPPVKSLLRKLHRSFRKRCVIADTNIRSNTRSTANKAKNRSRNITWFHPPYSKHVATNVGKKFLLIVNDCFRQDHPLRKIFNKNTLKISYSCMPNPAYMSNTVEPTLFVRMEQIRNLIRISDSTAFVSMLSNLLQSYEWSRFVT